MVKLIGLTWQRSQWCQSNPSLKPWWHHHTGECVRAETSCVWRSWTSVCLDLCNMCVCVCVCVWEREGYPAMNAKGVHGAVQVIWVKMFSKTHTGNAPVTLTTLIILICSLLSTPPHSHKQLKPPDRGVRRVQDKLIKTCWHYVKMFTGWNNLQIIIQSDIYYWLQLQI